MTESNQQAYDRGADAGRIEQRLAGYDAHFRTINGSIADTARELHDLVLAVQRLADQAVADAKTRVSTAEAVEKARQEAAGAIEAERRARSDRSATVWTVPRLAGAALGAIAALVALILGIKALFG